MYYAYLYSTYISGQNHLYNIRSTPSLRKDRRQSVLALRKRIAPHTAVLVPCMRHYAWCQHHPVTNDTTPTHPHAPHPHTPRTPHPPPRRSTACTGRGGGRRRRRRRRGVQSRWRRYRPCRACGVSWAPNGLTGPLQWRVPIDSPFKRRRYPCFAVFPLPSYKAQFVFNYPCK